MSIRFDLGGNWGGGRWGALVKFALCVDAGVPLQRSDTTPADS